MATRRRARPKGHKRGCRCVICGRGRRSPKHASNPPARRRAAVLIYPSGQIRGTWYGQHRDGVLRKHRFTNTAVAIYGNPDGSITFKPARGRLWDNF